MYGTSKTHPLAAFAKAKKDDTFTVPSDLDTLSVAELSELKQSLAESFLASKDEAGDAPTDEQLNELSTMVEALERVNNTLAAQEEAAAERAKSSDLLASKVSEMLATKDEEEEEEEDEEEDEEFSTDAPAADVVPDEGAADEAPAEDDEEEEVEVKEEAPAEELATAKAQALRVRRATRKTPAKLPAAKPAADPTQFLATLETGTSGYAPNSPVDFAGVSKILEQRLSRIPIDNYKNAAKRGQSMRQSYGAFTLSRPTEDKLTIRDLGDGDEAAQVLDYARNESRLDGNSLVASGGWCAPSETMYDILELEGRQGMFDLPSVKVERGGFRYTKGPTFADLYNMNAGFFFDEATDIAGTYGGPDDTKPCVKVDCPSFEEVRLEVAGLCITAGLLQLKGYPEYIERVIRGLIVAHDHRMSAKRLKDVYDGSTAITMPTDKGAVAPLLSAIELQAQHIRYLHRLDDSASIEVVLPEWIRGALRAELSRRDGLDVFNVQDSMLEGWMKMRGIAPQFVRNWQDLNAYPATGMTGWPDKVELLMYPAGTWVYGSSEIITVSDLYDSVNLGKNNYTALFTEESYLVAKMGHESRRLTVPLKYAGSIGPREAQTNSAVDSTVMVNATSTTTTTTTQ